MMGCSICGTEPAVLVDREHKGTYWMCGDCVFEMIEDKMAMERVVKAAEKAVEDETVYDSGRGLTYMMSDLKEALEALPEHLKEE